MTTQCQSVLSEYTGKKLFFIKKQLPSKTWRHHQSYYILACVPILCSSLILFRIALINANIKFSSCIKLDVSRQGIRTASSFIQASCYSDAEIILDMGLK
jgi:hypothetical protein